LSKPLKKATAAGSERPMRDGVLNTEDTMSHLTKREQPDRSKINMHQAYEVKYWTHALGISKEQLQKAVDTVGNSAAAVRKELAAGRGAA
jgi:Protein of unknown function (DUF3606)